MQQIKYMEKKCDCAEWLFNAAAARCAVSVNLRLLRLCHTCTMSDLLIAKIQSLPWALSSIPSKQGLG